MTTTSTTTQALPGIDLDQLARYEPEIGCGSHGPRAEMSEYPGCGDYVKFEDVAALIAQARAAQARSAAPAGQADEHANAAHAGQHNAGESVITGALLQRLIDEHTDCDFGLIVEPFARAVESEVARRCRAQGGETSNNSSIAAPVSPAGQQNSCGWKDCPHGNECVHATLLAPAQQAGEADTTVSASEPQCWSDLVPCDKCDQIGWHVCRATLAPVAAQQAAAVAAPSEPDGWMFGSSFYERGNPRLTDEIKRLGRPFYTAPTAAAATTSDAARWAKWIVQRGNGLPDHACAECVPHSDMLKSGFRCVYHEAVAAMRATQQEGE